MLVWLLEVVIFFIFFVILLSWVLTKTREFQCFATFLQQNHQKMIRFWKKDKQMTKKMTRISQKNDKKNDKNSRVLMFCDIPPTKSSKNDTVFGKTIKERQKHDKEMTSLHDEKKWKWQKMTNNGQIEYMMISSLWLQLCLLMIQLVGDVFVVFLKKFWCWQPPWQENNFSVATLLLSLSGTGGPNLTYSGCLPPKVCLKE